VRMGANSSATDIPSLDHADSGGRGRHRQRSLGGTGLTNSSRCA
jgi:hypothetical protein